MIYLDDITVYSKPDEQHLQPLKLGISLNPKNSNFALEEGKLLGYIISKNGIKIEPEREDAI